MSTLTTINTEAAKYAPSVLTAVVAVENTAKSLAGATKKALVVNLVQTAARVAEQTPNAAVSGIGCLVDIIVSILNAAGLFTHAPTDVAPAKPAPAN